MKIRTMKLTTLICPACNGLGFADGEPCHRCGGSGEEEVDTCIACGEEERNCSCFPREDLPVWCALEGSECPAPEEDVEEAIESLLTFCRSCPHAALSRKAA